MCAAPRPLLAAAARQCAASPVGVMLLDAALHPVYYNAAAASILGYPGKTLPPLSWKAVLPLSVSRLASDSTRISPSVTSFTSGRRHYVSRTFHLDTNRNGASRRDPRVLVVLERECTLPVDITPWSEEYQLTSRECETVTFLLRGLTSKEIAAEMAISPNTVKTFLKLVMAKMGAHTRTAIVAKLLERAAGNGSRTPS